MMIRTMVQLPEEQLNVLKELAKTRKTSVAKLVRESVAYYVTVSGKTSPDEKRKRAIALAGRYRSNEPGANVSEEHDKYLAEAYLK